MNKNVIVLTHGWTGSSVFTALLGRAGYWHGDQTFQKIDYDTHENAELVALNKRMLVDLGYEGDHERDFVTIGILEKLVEKSEDIDLAPYREFVEKCQSPSHRPWIWKDPRLTWTIRIWAQILPLDEIAFVILTRDREQAWISSNLRRHIQSRAYTKRYNDEITSSLKHFLQDNNCPFTEFEFEDLQLQPSQTIDALNSYLGVNLSMDDLTSVYTKPLYKKSKNSWDKLVALAIYLKNYGQRDNR